MGSLQLDPDVVSGYLRSERERERDAAARSALLLNNTLDSTLAPATGEQGQTGTANIIGNGNGDEMQTPSKVVSPVTRSAGLSRNRKVRLAWSAGTARRSGNERTLSPDQPHHRSTQSASARRARVVSVVSPRSQSAQSLLAIQRSLLARDASQSVVQSAALSGLVDVVLKLVNGSKGINASRVRFLPVDAAACGPAISCSFSVFLFV